MLEEKLLLLWILYALKKKTRKDYFMDLVNKYIYEAIIKFLIYLKKIDNVYEMLWVLLKKMITLLFVIISILNNQHYAKKNVKIMLLLGIIGMKLNLK